MKDYFSLSFNNLKRRKTRSWLTMVGIFIGIAAVVALISLGQGLQNSIEKQFQEFGSDRIIIEEKGVQGPPGSGTSQTTELTSKDIDAIKKVRGVKSVSGVIYKTGQIGYKDEIKFNFVMGISLEAGEEEALSFFDVEKGRKLKQGDNKKAIIGIMYAEGDIFEKEIGIGSRINLEGESFEVVGILEKVGNPFDDSSIIIPKEAMKETFNLNDEESQIYAKVEDVEEIDRVQEDIERTLRKQRNEKEGRETFQVTTADQFLEAFKNIFAVVQAVLVGIASISLLVGGVGIANTMYMSVLERTKEIGTMKAVGAKNSDILILFLIESGMLGLIGGVIGVGIGIGLSKTAEYIATSALGTNLLQASLNPVIIFGALAFSFVIGAASGIFPAYQASRLKPVDALRYE
jgi:putative ABC transport system permease protein